MIGNCVENPTSEKDVFDVITLHRLSSVKYS